MIGNGDANATAMSLSGQGATPVTFIHARHVLADGFGRLLAYQNYTNNPTATINFSNVPLGPGTIAHTSPGAPGLGGNQTAGNRGGDPLLLPNLSLPLNSPAVDIGGAPLLPGAPTDLAGNPRPADGNGDGVAAQDAGAFERVYTPDGAHLTIEGRKIVLNKHGKGAVDLTCPGPAVQPGPCTARVKLTTRKKFKTRHGKRNVLLARSKKPRRIPASASKPAKLKLKGGKLKLVQENRKARKVIATVKVADGYGETGTVTKKMKVKPAG